MNIYLQEKNPDFLAAIDYFKKDLATLRTGRANPAILEGIHVEAYGVNTPLNGLANVSVADSRSLTISPWDKNIMKDVEKAIIDANLNLGVVNEGDKIRISIPMMTEENRKELVKRVNEKQEKTKISIRQVREEIKTAIETAFSAKEMSEDDKFRYIKELDETTTKYNDEIKNIRDAKEKDIMEI